MPRLSASEARAKAQKRRASGQPPGPGGTASPERAKRYLEAGEGAAALGVIQPLPGKTKVDRLNVPSPKSPKSSPSRRFSHEGSAFSGSRRGSHAMWSGAGSSDRDAYEEDEPFEGLGPGAEKWRNFVPHEMPVGGKQWAHSTLGKRGGMSHPPRVPKVQADLLKYLEERRVPHNVQRRTVKSRAGDAQEQEAFVTSQLSRTKGSIDRDARRSSSATNVKDLGWTLPWAPTVPLPRGDAGGSRRGTKGAPAKKELRPAELWAQQANPQIKDGSKPLPSSFDDFDTMGKILMSRTNELCCVIDAKTVEDVTQLAQYHGATSRSIHRHTTDQRCEMSQTMRSFSDTLGSQHSWPMFVGSLADDAPEREQLWPLQGHFRYSRDRLKL